MFLKRCETLPNEDKIAGAKQFSERVVKDS